jgi:hypothetical protein
MTVGWLLDYQLEYLLHTCRIESLPLTDSIQPPCNPMEASDHRLIQRNIRQALARHLHAIFISCCRDAFSSPHAQLTKAAILRKGNIIKRGEA